MRGLHRPIKALLSSMGHCCLGGFDSFDQFSSVDRSMHSKHCYVSVTVMDSHICAIGGFDGEDRLRTAERYKPSTNQWTT